MMYHWIGKVRWETTNIEGGVVSMAVSSHCQWDAQWDAGSGKQKTWLWWWKTIVAVKFSPWLLGLQLEGNRVWEVMRRRSKWRSRGRRQRRKIRRRSMMIRKRRRMGRKSRRKINAYEDRRFHFVGSSLGGKRYLNMRFEKVKNWRCYRFCQMYRLVKLSRGDSYIGTGPQGRNRVSGRSREREVGIASSSLLFSGRNNWNLEGVSG